MTHRLKGSKIHIIYGFSEGPRLARRFHDELEKRGGTLTKNLDEADIVITHSGGCFFIPQKLLSKTVIIANPVCGSLYKFPVVMSKKILWDFEDYTRRGQFAAWLRKSLWNLWYMLSRPDRNIQMARKAPYYQYRLPEVQGRQVIILNNSHDPWARAVPHAEVAKHDYRYITLPGPHDDLWLNPTTYLDVLE